MTSFFVADGTVRNARNCITQCGVIETILSCYSIYTNIIVKLSVTV